MRLFFKKLYHGAILEGAKTTTLRRWRKCRVQAGDAVDAPGVGKLIVKAVEPIEWKMLTEADARADGFKSLAELNRAIRRIYPNLDGDGKSWFKLTFHLAKQAAGPAPPRQRLAAAVRAELDKAVRRDGR